MRADVRIARDEFVRALHPFRTLRKAAQSEEAILSLCEGSLVITIAGIERSVKADGMWEGQARVSGRVLTAVAKTPLSDDPVHIVIEGSTIRIGPLGYAVVWQGWAPAVIRLPMNASLDLILAVGQRYSSEEIERAGLSRRVEDSLRKLRRTDRRGHGHVRRTLPRVRGPTRGGPSSRRSSTRAPTWSRSSTTPATRTSRPRPETTAAARGQEDGRRARPHPVPQEEMRGTATLLARGAHRRRHGPVARRTLARADRCFFVGTQTRHLSRFEGLQAPGQFLGRDEVGDPSELRSIRGENDGDRNRFHAELLCDLPFFRDIDLADCPSPQCLLDATIGIRLRIHLLARDSAVTEEGDHDAVLASLGLLERGGQLRRERLKVDAAILRRGQDLSLGPKDLRRVAKSPHRVLNPGDRHLGGVVFQHKLVVREVHMFDLDAGEPFQGIPYLVRSAESGQPLDLGHALDLEDERLRPRRTLLAVHRRGASATGENQARQADEWDDPSHPTCPPPRSTRRDPAA